LIIIVIIVIVIVAFISGLRAGLEFKTGLEMTEKRWGFQSARHRVNSAHRVMLVLVVDGCASIITASHCSECCL